MKCELVCMKCSNSIILIVSCILFAETHSGYMYSLQNHRNNLLTKLSQVCEYCISFVCCFLTRKVKRISVQIAFMISRALPLECCLMTSSCFRANCNLPSIDLPSLRSVFQQVSQQTRIKRGGKTRSPHSFQTEIHCRTS